ncbi:MFS transporter [Thalassospira lucentensis]|uniref:MFS transporter n=1 Tax=Thalassospira lucentensis TaxID=168935 RepID=UPI00142D3AF7|nr:MFS transporter [Thalassospira lucentensis]NIZ00130.1 MFS transporter [Thalassospira lucentensis]
MFRIAASCLLAMVLFAVTFSVNLQAPLYSAYVEGAQYTAISVTTAFAAYVAGLMPTLMLLGGLSDRVGRRLPVVLALLLSGAATALLAAAPNWYSLMAARAMLGVGTGLATTAGTAYMAELLGEKHAKNAALLVTTTTALGFSGGALATGVSLNFQGHTFIPASFIFFLVLASILLIAAVLLPRSSKDTSVSMLRLPVFPEGTALYGLAMFIAWATSGMIISVVPLELKRHGYEQWTGAVVFLAIFMGFICQPIGRKLSNRTALAIGFFLIPAGFVLLLAGVVVGNISLVLIGTGITSSSSYGFTYLAALSEVSLRAPFNRARATAGLFVYAYLGFSVPVIICGVIADMIGLLSSLTLFGIAQFLATIVIVTMWIKRPLPETSISK